MKKFLTLSAVITISLSAPTLADHHENGLYETLGTQPVEIQARYAFRHPGETLNFFGIKPGMTVMEGLPGGGWYTKVLLPYLGKEGQLIGADYAEDMFPLFGFFSEELIASKATWVEDWSAEASGWSGDAGAKVEAFQFGSMPESMNGSADAALMIRAFHNLFRFQEQGYLDAALKDLFTVLKPGGVLGVVQHQAPDEMPASWASGARGYLKKATLIERIQQAGFVFEADSPINQNPHDQPGMADVVWRLPPNFNGTEEGTAARARMAEIGESSRMTLRFRKPE